MLLSSSLPLINRFQKYVIHKGGREYFLYTAERKYNRYYFCREKVSFNEVYICIRWELNDNFVGLWSPLLLKITHFGRKFWFQNQIHRKEYSLSSFGECGPRDPQNGLNNCYLLPVSIVCGDFYAPLTAWIKSNDIFEMPFKFSVGKCTKTLSEVTI